ncbi:DUF937 domain-containing protein [Novipirellula artificiosorum]|uniref:DUF937 domain-containing protein n=1 Tax=Novipirellula artificiosorum TaxID=2528016 RepID=A0A5C6DAU8_9BACT|nr:DUF937 domain-containing protein [Novipirellula artificiosorum]TWU33828.1 hypothetical protein Poly41_48270 [Novipirellula artificiosorum]
MNVNLMELAKTAIGSGALGQIAGSLGESEEKTKSAMDIASSAILGGLMQKVSSPQGAKDVFSQVSKFDTGLLDNLSERIGGGGNQEQASSWASMGGKLISSLLGDKESSLIGMIAKRAGIGQGSSKSLLSMLAPLLLGVIAKQVKSGNLDLSGLVSLILGQKAQVAKFLPSEATQQLGIANLLDQGADAIHDAGAKLTRATRETADTGAGLLKTLVPVLLVVGIGLLAWKLLSSPAKEVAQKTAEVAGAAVDATKDAAADVVDAADRINLNKPAVPSLDLKSLASTLGTSVTDLTKSISGVTDEATARETLPQINAFQQQFSGYSLDKMPEEATTTLRTVVGPLLEKLQAAIELAYKIPGVKEILEPATDGLMKTVSAFTKSA